jgi:F0F1-type ATP synthase alpha subunit
LTELLKQHQYQPASVWEQVASIYAVNSGAFDKVPVAKIQEVKAALLTRLWTDNKKEMQELTKGDEKIAADSPSAKLIEKTAIKVAKGFEE